MAYESKERSLGEILDAAVRIYGAHFDVLVGVAACVVLPTALVVSLLNWLIVGSADPTALDAGAQAAAQSGPTPPMPDVENMMRWALATMLTIPIQLLAAVVQDAVLTLAIADAHRGRPLSVRSSFQRSLPALPPVLGSSLMKGLGIGLGLVCLFIPGVVLMLRWLLSTQAIVVEGKPAIESLGRSRELTKENPGQLLVLTLALALVGVGPHIALRAILSEELGQSPVLGHLLQVSLQIVVAPVSSVVLTLVYFDRCVRTAGFDPERLSRSH